MVEKYRSTRKAVAAIRSGMRGMATTARRVDSSRRAVRQPSEWNGIRSRILSTPGVIGVDVSSLGGDGAVISLMYVGDLRRCRIPSRQWACSFQGRGHLGDPAACARMNLPNLITIAPHPSRAGDRLADDFRCLSRWPSSPSWWRASAMASMASSRAVSTSARSLAPISIRWPTRRCWYRSM